MSSKTKNSDDSPLLTSPNIVVERGAQNQTLALPDASTEDVTRARTALLNRRRRFCTQRALSKLCQTPNNRPRRCHCRKRCCKSLSCKGRWRWQGSDSALHAVWSTAASTASKASTVPTVHTVSTAQCWWFGWWWLGSQIFAGTGWDAGHRPYRRRSGCACYLLGRWIWWWHA